MAFTMATAPLRRSTATGGHTAKTCVIAEISARHGPLDAGIIGGLVDIEHDLIRTRTAEGRSRAKVQGRHMGRPPALPRATERGHRTPRARRYAARIGVQLQRGHI